MAGGRIGSSTSIPASHWRPVGLRGQALSPHAGARQPKRVQFFGSHGLQFRMSFDTPALPTVPAARPEPASKAVATFAPGAPNREPQGPIIPCQPREHVLHLFFPTPSRPPVSDPFRFPPSPSNRAAARRSAARLLRRDVGGNARGGRPGGRARDRPPSRARPQSGRKSTFGTETRRKLLKTLVSGAEAAAPRRPGTGSWPPGRCRGRWTATPPQPDGDRRLAR